MFNIVWLLTNINAHTNIQHTSTDIQRLTCSIANITNSLHLLCDWYDCAHGEAHNSKIDKQMPCLILGAINVLYVIWWVYLVKIILFWIWFSYFSLQIDRYIFTVWIPYKFAKQYPDFVMKASQRFFSVLSHSFIALFNLRSAAIGYITRYKAHANTLMNKRWTIMYTLTVFIWYNSIG